MLRQLCFLSLLLFIASSCYRPAPKQSFEDLKLLEGKWSTMEGAQFHEVWKTINDSLIIGIGYSLSGSDTAFKEQLKISLIDRKVFYAAKVSENSDYVFFEMKESGEGHWKFFNPDHDYPNIIEYKIIGDSSLVASTANIRGNKEIEFRFKRIN